MEEVYQKSRWLIAEKVFCVERNSLCLLCNMKYSRLKQVDKLKNMEHE